MLDWHNLCVTLLCCCFHSKIEGEQQQNVNKSSNNWHNRAEKLKNSKFRSCLASRRAERDSVLTILWLRLIWKKSEVMQINSLAFECVCGTLESHLKASDLTNTSPAYELSAIQNELFFISLQSISHFNIDYYRLSFSLWSKHTKVEQFWFEYWFFSFFHSTIQVFQSPFTFKPEVKPFELKFVFLSFKILISAS